MYLLPFFFLSFVWYSYITERPTEDNNSSNKISFRIHYFHIIFLAINSSTLLCCLIVCYLIFIFTQCITTIKALSYYSNWSLLSKHSLIIPTDVHNYKIIGMLKTIKIPTVTPTSFGSHRNHRQGTIQCLAKTINMVLLCSST